MFRTTGREESDFVDVMEEDKKKEFYQHLIKHSQLRTLRVLYVGSTSEIQGQDLMCGRYGLNAEELIDKDMMNIDSRRCAFSRRQTVPETFNGTVTVLRIFSEGQHPGYVKLLKEEDDTELQHSDIAILASEKGLDIKGVRHGPADTINTEILGKHFAKSYTQISLENFLANRGSKIFDDVHAAHCPFWPVQANEWTTRKRLRGFPSRAIIKKVVRYGCDLVKVSHKLNANDNEWRFSFSIAELTIITHWTRSQRIVYRTLHLLNKMIKSKNKNSVLCSYYFKTLILWATEEKLAEFWSADVLVNSVCELLCELTRWLKKKFCLNYFIPSNNMIDHLTDADLSADVDALCQQLQNMIHISDLLKECSHVEVYSSSAMYHIAAPMWLYTNPLVDEQIVDSYDKFTRLFSERFPKLVHNALAFQLSGVYNVLKYHKRVASCSTQSVQDNYQIQSFTHLGCLPLEATETRSTQQPCSKTVAGSFIDHFKQHNTNPDTNQLLSSPTTTFTDPKCVIYSQSTDDVDKTMIIDHFDENIASKNELSVILYTTSTVNCKTDTDVRFYKEFPGMSPTVNISWFVHQSYLANLYYTTQHDYDATATICDNVLNVYKQSFFNQRFSERLLPVIISTEWPSVYDEELQAMIGFYSLCSFTFHKSYRSRSVCLGVCSVQFALYLKFRCAIDQVNGLLKRFHDCIEHEQQCQGGERICNGRFAVLSAIRVMGMRHDITVENSTLP